MVLLNPIVLKLSHTVAIYGAIGQSKLLKHPKEVL